MPNAKLKCVQCGERKLRTEMHKINSVSSICNDIECKVTYATKKGRLAVKDRIKKAYSPQRSNTKKSNPLRTRKRATKEACHLYIRMRDKNNLCICCDEPLGNDYHAGHYLESGNNPKIRYDEDNIHAQRLYCNNFKGGDSGMYRVNLIKKIGLERVEALESKKGGTVKRTCDDYKEIENYFKVKIAKLD